MQRRAVAARGCGRCRARRRQCRRGRATAKPTASSGGRRGTRPAAVRDLRPSAGAPDHAFGDEMAGRRADVERQQAEAAGQFERAEIVGEGADDLVGEEGAALAVEAAAGGVVVRGCLRSTPFLSKISASCQASRMPRLKPWPETGCRVCAVLPIHTSLPLTSVSRRRRASGKRLRWPGLAKRHALAELGLQGGDEGVVVHRHHGVGLGRRQGEDDGVFVAERQQGERAVGREAFPGALVVAGRWRDFADHGVLVVVADLDGRVVAGRAFGMDQQSGLDRAQLAGVAQRDGDVIVGGRDVE